MNGLREGFFEGLREGLGPSSVKGRAPRGAPAKLGLWRRARVGEGAGPSTLFIIYYLLRETLGALRLRQGRSGTLLCFLFCRRARGVAGGDDHMISDIQLPVSRFARAHSQVIGYRLSVIGYRLAISSYQLSVISYQLSGYQVIITPLPITNYPLPVDVSL